MTVRVTVLQPEESSAAGEFRSAIAGRRELDGAADLRFSGPDDALRRAATTDVLVCGNVPPGFLAEAADLRWINFWSAGLDRKVSGDLVRPDLILSNSSGVHGPNMAEHVMAWMLMFTRGMHLHLASQREGVWRRDFLPHMTGASELMGQTLGIVGYGSIGRSIAARARAFGMRIVALSRTGPDPAAEPQPDEWHAREDLPRLLAVADHVCLALPDTPSTRQIVGAAEIASMKRGAYLYNVGRGSAVDEEALVAALHGGALGGAGLDVFEVEPLPPSSPLWSMPNVLISPHVAGQTPHYFVRAARIFADNLVRFVAGEPLQNVYDSQAGY